MTLFSQAFTDFELLEQAKKFLDGKLIKMGATDFEWVPQESFSCQVIRDEATIDLAVCGAHLSGMPLNHQLTDNNAVSNRSNTYGS